MEIEKNGEARNPLENQAKMTNEQSKVLKENLIYELYKKILEPRR